MAGRRCARAGCRAWAQRGGHECAAHAQQRRRRLEQTVAADEGVARARGQWTVQELRTLEALARRLASGESEGLAGEIAAARLTLAWLLREEADPVRLADGVAKAASVVFKARQMERLMSGETAESLAGAATRILEELGLGAEE